MFIDTTTFAGSTQAVDVTLSVPSLLDEAESAPVPAHLIGTLTRHRQGFRLVGRLIMDARVTCARCDEPFSLAVDTAFALLYPSRPPGPEPTAADGEFELREADCELAELDEKNRIDLVALAREQAHLSIPLKPICRDDCRGLCSHCGAKLNRGPCGCPEIDTDPRLGVLADLKRRMNATN